MATSFKTIFILLFFVSLLQAEDIKLAFPSFTPVQITYEASSTSRHRDAGQETLATGKEHLLYELLINDEKEKVDSLPLFLSYRLLDYTSEINSEGKKFFFDAKSPSHHFTFLEIRDLLDKKIDLTLEKTEKGFILVDSHSEAELLKSSQEKLSALLFSKLKEPFYIIELPLSPGAKIEIPIEMEAKFKKKLTYEILSIDEDEVRAKVILDIPRQKMEGQVVVSGYFTGQIVWDRRNPLLFFLEIEGSSATSVKKGEGEVMVDMDVKITHSSVKEKTLKNRM